jgi:hypothetical protein
MRILSIPRRFSASRLISRTKLVTTKIIAAIPAESIPFIGVAVLIADTGYELYTACETVRNLDQLYVDFGMADEVQEDAMHSVCDPELPDAGEVWGGVVENMDQWWESLVEAVQLILIARSASRSSISRWLRLNL